jgi:hypothetical protein
MNIHKHYMHLQFIVETLKTLELSVAVFLQVTIYVQIKML